MRLTKHIQRNELTKKAEYLYFEIKCKTTQEMDKVRELFQKIYKDTFNKSVTFESCYSNDEVENFDIISFEYDINDSVIIQEEIKEVWEKVKYFHKQQQQNRLYGGF